MIRKHKYIAAKLRIRKAGGDFAKAKQLAFNAAIDHLKYIQNRPGPDRDLGGRQFFDEENDRIDGKDVRQWLKDDYKGQNIVLHTLMLSLEINTGDHKAYARHVMKELEGRLGQDIDWKAVVHKNTEHYHVHAVILPKDKAGKPITLKPKDYECLDKASDEYLSREHPTTWERVLRDRVDKELLREVADRKRWRVRKRLERDREFTEQDEPGSPVPFLGRKGRAAIREQFEPYDQWRRLPENQKRARPQLTVNDKEYSEDSTFEELKKLNYQSKKDPELLSDKERSALVRLIEIKVEDERDAKIFGPNYKHDPDSFLFAGKKYSKESSYEDLLELDTDIKIMQRYDRQSEREERKLPRKDAENLKSWIDEKQRKFGAEMLRKQLHHAAAQTPEQLYQMEINERANPESLAAHPVPFLTEQPIAEKSEAKLLELPHDELELIKQDIDELARTRYQMWQDRQGRRQQNQRLEDERAMKQYKATRSDIEKIQQAREGNKRYREERLREALMRDLFDID